MSKLMFLLEIIVTFMKIDIISFGGGYVAIPLVEKSIVEVKHWMTYSEFADLMALDELTPGPIMINCATFVGNKVAGFAGGVAATFGAVLPTFIVALILARIYAHYKNVSFIQGALKGIRCMVVGLLASTVYSLFKNMMFVQGSLNPISVLVFVAGLFVLRKYKPDPLAVILGCGALGFILQLVL